MHDDSLKRTCGVNAMVKEKTMAELQECCLEGTEEKIPILSQVLNIVNGQVPLLIEIKTVRGDYKEICRAVCRELDTYKGLYCIESFDPRVLHWLKKNRPDMAELSREITKGLEIVYVKDMSQVLIEALAS